MIVANKYIRFTFSGHESFQCRHLWLKKGFDYVSKGNSFNSEDAVVDLGVGKNMVSSIRFWMKAFDLIDNSDNLTVFAQKLLSDEGWDPFLEDEASLWLLHYHLISKGFASTYSFIFNELRREKIEFTKEHYISFVKRKAEMVGGFQVNDKTLAEDFGVMVKMYIRSDAQSRDKEDTFSGILTELDLIKNYGKRGEELFIIENSEKPELPDEVLLYAIANAEDYGLSVDLSAIENGINSPGAIFALSRSGLINKLESIVKKYKGITYSDQAGVKELQFKKKIDPFEILQKYYAS